MDPDKLSSVDTESFTTASPTSASLAPPSLDASSLDASTFAAAPLDGAARPRGNNPVLAGDRPGSTPLARRVVLRAGVVVPVGLGMSSVAACGDDSGTGGGSGGDGSTEAEASQDEQTPEADASDSSEEAESQVSGSDFPTADVPVGAATYDEPSNTVFSQPNAGEFRAFDATCPHQGCAVSEFQDGSLLCPCHGSMFDPATGDVVSGPATTGLTPREVTVEGDNLVVG